MSLESAVIILILNSYVKKMNIKDYKNYQME